MCNQANDQEDHYCVVAGAGFSSTKTVTAHGAKPLVVLSTTTLAISGIIDVGSYHGGQTGAGANPTGLCTNATPPTGSSGAYGGSFGGAGGAGELTDGVAGSPAPALTGVPTALRGGCPGGAGSPTGAGGAGGSGGGALLVIADELDFAGLVNASGAGGAGGALSKSGGGGGGSGGMIVVDATSYLFQEGYVGLFANGGAGAEGGATTAAGAAGGESTLPPSLGGLPVAALKGSGHDGGDGGDGSNGVGLTGHAAAGAAVNGGGGGAGGGGAGIIHGLPLPFSASVVSPPTI